MSEISKFKLLFALKLNFNGVVNYKRNIKLWLFQKVEKIQNKFIVAKEIRCRNDIVLSKIGWGNKLRQKNRQTDK